MIKKILKYLLVGFLGLFCLGVVISIIDPNSKKASTAHEVSSTDPDSLNDKARPNLPNDQVEFINIIESFSDSYSAGENDFKKGAERTKRKAKLCSSFRTRKISNWYGTVKSLSSNNTGYGILNISIAPYINLATTNNEFSDNLSEIHTLIHPEDPVFSDLGNIKEGQTVKFSGVFIPDTTDCFLVQAITQNGAMTDPEFEVKFQSVKPAD